ncbi:DUF2855 family protein [Minwuia sp.]|uniref:DUF2855 family protein n=1 Tax=Minwuia sp. TaxID=2493630 RepID=UPI003A939EE8
MTDITTFEVRKDDLATSRVTRHTATLAEGQVLAKVDRFALTANNVTYGVVGEKIGYWQFFPTGDDGWGVVPVWGVAEVVESRHPEVPVGERLYGYWPMGSHLVMAPVRVGDGTLFDGADHRADLPPVYNRYTRLTADPAYDLSMDDARMVLWPLYATSFCLYDFLKDNGWFGAAQVILPSASSKTAIGTAYALTADPDAPRVIGVTSQGNRGMVENLGLYAQVLTYDAIEGDLANVPSVIVDMSGNGDVLGRMHRLLGDNMRYTSNVGLTHYDANQMGGDFIRERSAMFFAPGHIQKRSKDWGKGEFDRRAAAFWAQTALKSRDWLTIDRQSGADAVAAVWAETLAGDVPPAQGRVVGF